MKNTLDEQLIRILQNNGRQSSNVIAKQLGVSSATIRRRIKKLVDSGLLYITARVDPDKAGFPFRVVIALDVVHQKVESTLQYLASLPEVTWAATTTGRFDIILRANFPSSDDYSEFVRDVMAKLDGLRDSETFVCLHIEKGFYQIIS
jgi:Lrp/AsnC family transcriptional regulator for asnA, asnC and gidA